MQKTSDSAVFDVLNKYTNLELSDNDASNSNNHTSNSRIYRVQIQQSMTTTFHKIKAFKKVHRFN